MGTRTATYGQVLRDREFRALFLADVVSLLGDQVAVVALAILVYDRTGSPFLAAATYALSYVPWVVGGPLLASLADRYPRRRVLLVCCGAECVLIALAALPGLPVPVLLTLVGAAAFLVPPFQSAWGALVPEVLSEAHYPLALSMSQVAYESAQLGGFVAGGALVVLLTPRGALLADAGTFVLAALVIAVRVRRRPAPNDAAESRTSLLEDTRTGIAWVSGHAQVRTLLLLIWLSTVYLVVPEALAVGYAAELDRGPRTVGVLMAAAAGGVVVGSAVLTRLVPHARQLGLVRPLAVAGALPLLVVALHPGLVVSVVCFALAGACSASMIPARAAIMTVVPTELRGRVYGVAATGLALAQVIGMLGAGAAAQVFAVSTVISAAGVLGLVVVGGAVLAGAPLASSEQTPAGTPS